MNRKTKWAALALVAAMALGLLTACGHKPVPTDDAVNNANAELDRREDGTPIDKNGEPIYTLDHPNWDLLNETKEKLGGQRVDGSGTQYTGNYINDKVLTVTFADGATCSLGVDLGQDGHNGIYLNPDYHGEKTAIMVVNAVRSSLWYDDEPNFDKAFYEDLDCLDEPKGLGYLHCKKAVKDEDGRVERKSAYIAVPYINEIEYGVAWVNQSVSLDMETMEWKTGDSIHFVIAILDDNHNIIPEGYRFCNAEISYDESRDIYELSDFYETDDQWNRLKA